MIVCIGIYILLFILRLWKWNKKLFCFALVINSIALMIFCLDCWGNKEMIQVERNSYGEGTKSESLYVSIDGTVQEEPLEIEIEERQYTKKEVRDVFKQVMEQLDELILGENESLDRVETDLNLVTKVEGYAVDIQWELDSYEVLDYQGKIIEEELREEGTLVELRGNISYEQEQATYVAYAMVYPKSMSSKDKLLNQVEKHVGEIEKNTRKDKSFLLPTEINGKTITWKKEEGFSGYNVLLFGSVLLVLLVAKEKQDETERKKKERDQMVRDYPDIVSKFTLLLSTGITVKNAWTKIVQEYETQRENQYERKAYVEMGKTLREMQSGVSEREAYERFGKRCEVVQYLKFGALLSQNIKKGSKGLSEILKLESIQAFENRKNSAKRLGEEASTKLLLPMMGMLTVVMIMVIIPAFLSIKL